MQTHYQDVGKFWKMKKAINVQTGLELESINASACPSPQTPVSTRSQTQQGNATTTPHYRIAQKGTIILSVLPPALYLLSKNRSITIPPTIMEEDESVQSFASALSMTGDDSFITATQVATPSIPSSKQPSSSTFQRAFGGRTPLNQLQELEEA